MPPRGREREQSVQFEAKTTDAERREVAMAAGLGRLLAACG